MADSSSARPRASTSTTCTTTSSAGTTRAARRSTTRTARSPPDSSSCPTCVGALELIADEGPSALHTGDLARMISDDVHRPRRDPRPGRPRGIPPRRPTVADEHGRRVEARHQPAAVGRRRVRRGDAAAARGSPRAGPDVDHLVRVQRAVLGHRLDILDHSDDLERDAAAFLDLIDRDHLAVLESGSTAHVSATDSDGGACAVTVSSGYSSGMIAKGTGIWLNNCLGEQELNAKGLHGLAPGTRLLSNMAPTVGHHPDGSSIAIGSPGADRITTAIVQVLAGFINGGLGLQDAVNHPRVHVHRAGRPDEDVKVETTPSMYYGGVGVTLRKPDGRLVAAADPRRDGAVRLVHARMRCDGRDEACEGPTRRLPIAGCPANDWSTRVRPISWPSSRAPTSSSPMSSAPRTVSSSCVTRTRSAARPTSPSIPSSPTARPPRSSTAFDHAGGSPRTSPSTSSRRCAARSAFRSCAPEHRARPAPSRSSRSTRCSTSPRRPAVESSQSASTSRPSTRRYFESIGISLNDLLIETLERRGFNIPMRRSSSSRSSRPTCGPPGADTRYRWSS